MSQIYTTHGSNTVTGPETGLGIHYNWWGASIRSLKTGDHSGSVYVPVSTLSARDGKPCKITHIHLVYATGVVSSIESFTIHDPLHTTVNEGHTQQVNLKNTAPTLVTLKLSRAVEIKSGVAVSFQINIPGGGSSGRWATIASVGLQLNDS